MTRDRRRRIVLLLAAVPTGTLLALASAVVVAPSVRREARGFLGLHKPLGACVPRTEAVRLPGGTPTKLRWEEHGAFPLARDELRAAVVGGVVYVGSGVRPGRTSLGLEPVGDLFAFDPLTGEYERLPDLPRRLDHPAVAASDGQLYVVGGYVDSKPVADAWRYSPQDRRWARLPPLSVPRGGAAAAIVRGLLIVVGGSSGRHEGANPEANSVVEVLEPNASAWRRWPDLPTARHHHAVATLGRFVYAVGGRGSNDMSLPTVERLGVATRRWEKLAPLPLGSGGVALVAIRDRVLVAIGGGDDAEGWVTPATWAYDVRSDRWHRLPDLNVARHGHAAAAFGGQAYVFGGSPCPGYGATDAVERLDVVEAD